MVTQTLSAIFKAISKLESLNITCGCDIPWRLYQAPFSGTQKLVYDTQDDCMKDLYILSCPDCGEEYTFESDPLDHLRTSAEEVKKILKTNPSDERYIVRGMAKFEAKK